MTIIKNELDDSVYKCSLMLTTMLKYVCPDAKVSYDTQAQVFFNPVLVFKVLRLSLKPG